MNNNDYFTSVFGIQPVSRKKRILTLLANIFGTLGIVAIFVAASIGGLLIIASENFR